MFSTYDEAKCEKRTALNNVRCHVSAMVTLTNDALVAWHVAAEGFLAANEEKEHGESRYLGRRRLNRQSRLQ